MNYKKIVAEAWVFTQENKGLIFWYSAIASVFTTLVGIGYLLYQYYALVSSSAFQNWDESFSSVLAKQIIGFIQARPNLLIPLIVAAVFVALMFFIFPIFCQGALIQIIARKRNGQKVRLRQGISFGMLSFLPLFEYHLLIRTFSIWSVMGVFTMTVRTLGFEVLNVLLPAFIVLVLIALIIAVIFTYTDYYIVIDEEGVFPSIGKSVALVVKHLEETLFLTLLMILIGIRIIVQVFFVLAIPVGAIGILYLFTSVNLPILAWWVAASSSIIGLFFASYLNGVIHVFAVSVWTFTFLRLTTNQLPSAREASKE